MEQLYNCQNTIRAQEQIIGRNHHRQLDLEAKTDHHIHQIAKDPKDTNTRVNTVTARTNTLEQCFHTIAQRFEVIDKQQEQSFQDMQHNIKQDQEQLAQNIRQETRKNSEDSKQWMMKLWGDRGPEKEAPSPPTTLVLPSTSKRSRYTSTLTQSTYETSNLTDKIQAKQSTGKAPKILTINTTPITESIVFPPAE